jgi:hypothetical protein
LLRTLMPDHVPGRLPRRATPGDAAWNVTDTYTRAEVASQGIAPSCLRVDAPFEQASNASARPPNVTRGPRCLRPLHRHGLIDPSQSIWRERDYASVR